MSVGGRLGYIDLFRGLLMAHMALDHASLFFNPARWALEFASHPPPMAPPLAQFLTRFTGVFVAPGFSFIAGFMVAVTGGAREGRGIATTAVTRRLITRGLVLIGADAVLFSFPRHRIELEVLSCVGASLIVLALLRRLSSAVLGLMALGIMGLHPLLDLWWMPAPLAWMLHEPHRAGRFRVWYPLIPWVGVMLFGYVMGQDAMTRKAPSRRWLVLAGVSLALFFVVRLAGGYGNAYPHHGLGSLDFWISPSIRRTLRGSRCRSP